MSSVGSKLRQDRSYCSEKVTPEISAPSESNVIGTTTVCPGIAGIDSGMLSDGLAGTGVAVGVCVGVGVNVGVAVAVDVGVGVGVEIRIEPSSVVPSRGTPLSFPYIAGGSDENRTPASAWLHDAPAVTVKVIFIITPSGIAANGATLSLMTVSISPSASSGLWLTNFSLNCANRSGNVTEYGMSPGPGPVSSNSKHDSS